MGLECAPDWACPISNTWKTVNTCAHASSAGLIRGQSDADRFGCTLAATVDGASFMTRVVNGGDAELSDDLRPRTPEAG